MKSSILTVSILLAVLLFQSCKDQVPPTPDEAREIAKEAFIYGFPMVVNYKTMFMYTLWDGSPEYKGPFNQLACDARLLTPEDRAVVTPNADTPYCMSWVDIRNEPLVISLPEMEADRFYHFQLTDLYTHNFAYLGTLTTGNGAGKYLIAEESWAGKVPEGINQVIRCETGIFFMIVRTQMMDQGDLENIKRIMGEYRVETLSEFLGEAAPERKEELEFPEWKEGDQFSSAGFTYLDVMLKLSDPVTGEVDLRKRFTRLGIGTEEGFDPGRFNEDIQKAMDEGAKEGFEEMEAFIAAISSDPRVSAKIFGTREFLTNSARKNYQLEDLFMLRAVAAHTGLYGNSGEEAIYPTYSVDSEGTPLNASEGNYTLTFTPHTKPPVKAFWSITMYDAGTQLFIHNPLNRYLLNSNMQDDFVYGEDGSLTFYLQKESPGPELEDNWLPAPDGPFYATMRLYGPDERALNGEWINPPLIKSE